MTTTEQIPTFFADGIAFECVHCGTCCTGQPGIVQINEQEIESLAAHLSLSRSDCIDRYLIPYADGYRVREKSTGDCVFFDHGCTVHAVRPSQCRTYPFWRKNMRSQDRWQRTCAECPGIGLGPIHSETDILEQLHASPI